MCCSAYIANTWIDIPFSGGYVCLGQFLHNYLAGSKIPYDPYVHPGSAAVP